MFYDVALLDTATRPGGMVSTFRGLANNRYEAETECVNRAQSLTEDERKALRSRIRARQHNWRECDPSLVARYQFVVEMRPTQPV